MSGEAGVSDRTDMDDVGVAKKKGGGRKRAPMAAPDEVSVRPQAAGGLFHGFARVANAVTVCVSREPLARLRSAYVKMKQLREKGTTLSAREVELLRLGSFEAFVMALEDGAPAAHPSPFF